jgi:hypothetical protein
MDSNHDGPEPHPIDDVGAVATGDPAPRRSSASRAVAVTVAVAMVLGGVVLATRAGGGADATATLTAAKSAFTDDVTYRFSFATVEELSAGEPDGAGVDTVTRTVTTGRVAAPDRWSVSTDKGAGWTEETIRTGGTLYRRSLDEHDPSNDGRWVEAPASDIGELRAEDLVYELAWLDTQDPESGSELGEADRAWRASMRSSARLGIVATGHALDSAVDPARLTRLVREADDAEIIEQRADGTTLRATVPPPAALAEAIKDPLPDAEVEIDLDADDRPLAVRVELAENGATLRVDLRFSDWGTPILVDAPADDAIDHTPSVDEEVLRTVDPGLLLVPTAVPEGLKLRSATVTSGTDGCSIVTLEYWPVTDRNLTQAELDERLSESNYLWLNTHLQSCAGSLGVGIDKSFDETLGGHPARRDWGWEVAVGSAVVALDSNLEAPVMEAIAASLRPVDADTLIDSVDPGR